MSITETLLASENGKEMRAKLRKLKKLSMKAKRRVLRGCVEPAAYMQFHEDLRLYGMWEALLYIEGAEGKAFMYGTAQNVLDALI